MLKVLQILLWQKDGGIGFKDTKLFNLVVFKLLKSFFFSFLFFVANNYVVEVYQLHSLPITYINYIYIYIFLYIYILNGMYGRCSLVTFTYNCPTKKFPSNSLRICQI
jgi:hypothetical protein